MQYEKLVINIPIDKYYFDSNNIYNPFGTTLNIINRFLA